MPITGASVFIPYNSEKFYSPPYTSSFITLETVKDPLWAPMKFLLNIFLYHGVICVNC